MLSIQDHWLHPVRRVVSPNFDERPAGQAPDLIVIHSISLPPGCYGGSYIEQLFTNCLDPQAHPYFATIHQLEVSSHVLIDRQGNIVQFVPFDARAWHAGVSEYQGRSRCNDFSIGIELEGTDNSAYTADQYHSLAALTRCLLDHYPSLSTQHITGHEHIAPGRKTDPGVCFEWQRFLASVERSG